MVIYSCRGDKIFDIFLFYFLITKINDGRIDPQYSEFMQQINVITKYSFTFDCHYFSFCVILQ